MSILFQQDFDNIHVSFYRNMKSHVVEKDDHKSGDERHLQ